MILMKYLALPADRKDDINKELEAYEAQLLAEKQRKRDRSNANLEPGDHAQNLQPGSNAHNEDENLGAEAFARKHAKCSAQCSQCKVFKTADHFGGWDRKQWRDRANPSAELICSMCPDHKQCCATCKKSKKSVDYCRTKRRHTALGWRQKTSGA